MDFNNLTDSTTKKVFTDERHLEKQRLVRGKQGSFGKLFFKKKLFSRRRGSGLIVSFDISPI